MKNPLHKKYKTFSGYLHGKICREQKTYKYLEQKLDQQPIIFSDAQMFLEQKAVLDTIKEIKKAYTQWLKEEGTIPLNELKHYTKKKP